ncbi:MAG: AAA family ATPase [Deltaproteobacteria bacterium]|nr:AAA family ATPase [Deltaproteobacteria bacterium]
MKCPKCKTELPETANFCLKCGQGLNLGEQPPRPGPIPKAERKRVTALFSDLTGYTAMTERLDPEEVKEITSRIFDGTRAIIKKYEGFIERFAGDGVLALFGVPRAHEDDPTRAIRAAREIHKFVETLSPRYETKVGRALSMHSGINTGLAVTADVNPEKGTHGVTGEAINVAARLSDLAEARDILVGPDTYKASKSQFTFQPLKPAKVKGKSERIPIYKVLSEKTATARVSQEMQVSSEMVGRDQELAKLELHVLKAVNGQGSVVNVFGEPGVGKSRLLAELRKREVIKRASFLEGRCISIGKNLSFHPLIDLFKQWAKIKEDDTQAEASNKLETAIRRICGDETDEVFPFVATMMGMKLSGKHSERVEGIEGEALEKLILRNVRELLIRSSELIPIVILMEDLHWADTTSLELLESLFRLAQTSRVVFINIFRPGYWQGDDRKVETLPKWLSEVDFAEIAIKPLDRQAGETLVNNILQVKGLRHAVKKQIVDRSGGNPFFMEEIVRSLIDEGAIVRTNGAFEVTDKMDHVVIPSTINDVLTARIDRLEEQTRDLIKIASVIGRSFFDRILKEVADSIEQVDERLAYLKDAQFIRDRMRMEELEYLFKHALAQEAAYESTLIQQRKELHLKVAQSIEKIFQERVHEFYGMLAFHYSKADDLEKAEEYMTKAGEEALRSSAASEALNYLQEALKLYTDRYGDQADPERGSFGKLYPYTTKI